MQSLSRHRLRDLLYRYGEMPTAKAFLSVGLTANMITILGFCGAATAAVLIAIGFNVAAGTVFAIGCLLDLIDGTMARISGKVTRLGALLDSLMDRLGEGILFIGIGLFALRSDLSTTHLTFFMVTLMFALLTSQTVSYLRARGESLGIATQSALMTRPERVVLLSVGLIFGLRSIEIVLIIIGALSLIAMLQRFLKIKSELAISDQNVSQGGQDKHIGVN